MPDQITNLQNKIAELEKELAQNREFISNLHIIDTQTGLYNRNYLQEAVKTAGSKCLMIVDIDKFSSVNSVYGAKVADYVIEQVALIMQTNKPNNAELFRYAGDVFAYLISNPKERQGEEVALQLLSYVSHSHIYCGEIEIKVGLTIGIGYSNSDQIVSQSMNALLDAKQKGCNRFSVYSKELDSHKKQESNLYWIPRVRNAIENEAIRPWFQPIACNKTGDIVKYEALARLQDEEGNIVDPYYFLEAAEVSGILTSITKAMITHSFKFFEGTNIKFSINITDSDLQEGYLEELLDFRTKRHNIEPSQVTLEIVENITATQASSHTDQLIRLKKRGFMIAVDDFGAEHSNFSRLLAIDLDYIKIDGRFIRNLDLDGRSQMIVKNIVNFSKSIGTKTIAEFVSTPEVYEKVKELGIDYSQGYFIGKPSADLSRVRD